MAQADQRHEIPASLLVANANGDEPVAVDAASDVGGKGVVHRATVAQQTGNVQ
jgi:hypothetical protein